MKSRRKSHVALDRPNARAAARRSRLRIATALLPALLTISTAVLAQPAAPSAAATLFEKSCYSCHNINGGDKTGPDLKGLTQRRTPAWIRSFVASPSKMQRSGDATAAELFRKFSPTVMPDQSISPEQIDALSAFIEEVTLSGKPFVPAGAKLKRPVRAGDENLGYRIFTGADKLANGAPPCVSCHTIARVGALGGGTLGPDLTAVAVRFPGPALIGTLQNPNFPTMASLFGKAPMTDEEIVRLYALFQQEAAAIAHAPTDTAGGLAVESRFPILGAITMLAGLGLITLIWRRRLDGVREPLVRSSKP